MVCVQCVSVCVRVLLCLIFIIAVHLGKKVIFYPLSPLTLLVTVNSCNATQTILIPSVPEIRNFLNSSHPLFVIVATHLPTSKGWKPEFWLSVPVSWTSDLLHGYAQMNWHARCKSVCALINWANQTDCIRTGNQNGGHVPEVVVNNLGTAYIQCTNGTPEEHNRIYVNTMVCRRESQIKDGRLKLGVVMTQRNISASILDSNDIPKTTPTFSGSDRKSVV